MDHEQILIDKHYSELLYQIAKGDKTQIDSLMLTDEVQFYFILQNHEKRMEFEAKYPRMPFF